MSEREKCPHCGSRVCAITDAVWFTCGSYRKDAVFSRSDACVARIHRSIGNARLRAERDAAIQRAEAAEKDRDELRELHANQKHNLEVLSRLRDEAVKRAEAAEAIVARLPKTADGVPVKTGDEVWAYLSGKLEAVTIRYGTPTGVYTGCYSTREAAERAGSVHNA